MTTPTKAGAVIAAASCALLLCACATPDPSSAKVDNWRIWVATAKGFDGEVRYMGDRDGYSYFLIGDYLKRYYKKTASETALHEHFPLGSGHSYRPAENEIVKK